MKILFYDFTMYVHLRGVLVDEAIRLAKEGNEVIYLYNNCCVNRCTLNMISRTLTCAMCQIDMRNTLKLLPMNIEQVDLATYWQPTEERHFDYKNVNELKRIEYNGVKIGYSVLSSYINATRNLYPKIDAESKPYFDVLLQNACNITNALERAIQQIKPDRLCFFNARMIEWRPAFDLAIKHHIETCSYENTGGFGEEYYIRRYFNSTPHDIRANYEMSLSLWKDIDMPMEEKVRIAKSFFNKRRNAIPAGDKVYIADQVQGKLPDDWDEKVRNIVIFNSSEDEYAAIGDEYDQYALFPSQYQGIRTILDITKNIQNTHIYLRIHPNLKNIEYRYHTELLKLQDRYSHLTVIPGNDTISSYALMDAAKTVVVFGSTIGLESAYWGKPVILLAGSSYYHSNLCYVPRDVDELKKFLVADLAPKDNTDALKIAFKILFRNSNDKWKYIDFNRAEFGFWKYKWHAVKYLKLFGSYKLYQLYYSIVKQFYKRNVTQVTVPTEEDTTMVDYN